MLALKKFKENINKIKDFTPYLETKHPAYLREMARQGICIEELAKLKIVSVTIVLIETNQAAEYYDEWLNHPNMNVRWALARRGLYPEKLLLDKMPDVRLPIIQQYPCIANNVIGKLLV